MCLFVSIRTPRYDRGRKLLCIGISKCVTVTKLFIILGTNKI